MERLWRFIRALLGWRTDETAEQHPHLRLGPGGDYTQDVWLDGHRWRWNGKGWEPVETDKW